MSLRKWKNFHTTEHGYEAALFVYQGSFGLMGNLLIGRKGGMAQNNLGKIKGRLFA